MKRLTPFLTLFLVLVGLSACQQKEIMEPIEIQYFAGEAISNGNMELPSPMNPDNPADWSFKYVSSPMVQYFWIHNEKSGVTDRSLAVNLAAVTPATATWEQVADISQLKPGSELIMKVDIKMEDMAEGAVQIQLEGLRRAMSSNDNGSHNQGCGNNSQEASYATYETIAVFGEHLTVSASEVSPKSGFLTYELPVRLSGNLESVRQLKVSLTVGTESKGRVYFDNVSVRSL